MSGAITILPRFRRSVRIDTDFRSRNAIDGFFCPPSFSGVLAVMARHVSDTGQGAFTWTGPYGGGKSSLALALACLTGAPKAVRDEAASLFGDAVVSELKGALPWYPSRWDVLPLVMEKRSIFDQLCEAVELNPREDTTTQTRLFDVLEARSENRGLLLILDELGRGLEAAAQGENDLHILQDLAELASRSQGRLLVVGILHQTFNDYARDLPQTLRDDWAKIQGRFVDIAITTTLDETLDLIGRALPRVGDETQARNDAQLAVDVLRPRPNETRAAAITRSLIACAPLHPLVAALLAPLSRRRFAQNQRSVFSFLEASERYGFRDIMEGSDAPAAYTVDCLWDYVLANFEAAVLASPDGRRWTVAADTLERCEARGGTPIECKILKTVGMLELLKDRSALVATPETLSLAVPGTTKTTLKRALSALESASELVFRKHSNSYALYAGSDFDIEASVNTLRNEDRGSALTMLRNLADLPPVLAKRHHLKTGAMRWFSLDLVALDETGNIATEPNGHEANLPKGSEIAGRVVLVVPTVSMAKSAVATVLQSASASDRSGLSLYGYDNTSTTLLDDAAELDALSRLSAHFPELRGDRIARREIENRSSELRSRIEARVHLAFDNSVWSWQGGKARHLSRRALSACLSDRADQAFTAAPRLRNELLNCAAPSPNAISGRTKLMKRMVSHAHAVDLGFEGKTYPAERGLYESLLVLTKLHGPVDPKQRDGMWDFQIPPLEAEKGLRSLWDEADRLLAETDRGFISAQHLIDAWSERPIGLKAGLGPVFLVAYALSRRDSVAVYAEGIFQSRMNDLTVDYLARDPSEVGLRRVEMEGLTRNILLELAIWLELDGEPGPLAVARDIVARFDALVPWLTRTQSLSPLALRVRELLKRAHDPNKMLFDDFPSLVEASGDVPDPKAVAKTVWDALSELRAAYPRTLADLKSLLLHELDVRGDDDNALMSLRARAATILQIGGDLRVDGFISRIAQYYGTEADMEGLAGLAANRLPRDWNDSDREKARVGLAELARQFLRLEALAHVKGRKDHRQALAVVVGRDNAPVPLFESFEVSETDRDEIQAIVDSVKTALGAADDGRRELILAALVEITSRYLLPETMPSGTDTTKSARRAIGAGR